MATHKEFLLDALSRIGTSVFSGTLVSCLLLHRIEQLHWELMGVGIVMMLAGYPVYRR